MGIRAPTCGSAQTTPWLCAPPGFFPEQTVSDGSVAKDDGAPSEPRETVGDEEVSTPSVNGNQKHKAPLEGCTLASQTGHRADLSWLAVLGVLGAAVSRRKLAMR